MRAAAEFIGAVAALSLAALSLLCLSAPPSLRAQTGPGGEVASAPRGEVGRYTVPGPAALAGIGQDTTPAGGADTTAYRRETFVYPVAGRRDPFRPLAAGPSAGPSFANLRLAGILFSPRTGGIAVLVDVATGRRYRLREGDPVGEARLVEVRPDAAVFQVAAFGVTRREVLQVKNEKESSP